MIARVEAGNHGKGRMMYDHEVTDVQALVVACESIQDPLLRRAVARCLWFDLCDQVPASVCLSRLKELAEIHVLDRSFMFPVEEFKSAMMSVGYTEMQVSVRLRIHCEQRRREQCGTCFDEYTRVQMAGQAPNRI